MGLGQRTECGHREAGRRGATLEILRVDKVLRQFNAATLAKLNIDNQADRLGHNGSIKELSLVEA